PVPSFTAIKVLYEAVPSFQSTPFLSKDYHYVTETTSLKRSKMRRACDEDGGAATRKHEGHEQDIGFVAIVASSWTSGDHHSEFQNAKLQIVLSSLRPPRTDRFLASPACLRAARARRRRRARWRPSRCR